MSLVPTKKRGARSTGRYVGWQAAFPHCCRLQPTNFRSAIYRFHVQHPLALLSSNAVIGLSWTKRRTLPNFHFTKRGPQTANPLRYFFHVLAVKLPDETLFHRLWLHRPEAPELPRFGMLSQPRIASWTAPNTIRQPSRAAIDPNKHHVPTKTAPTYSR